MLNDRKVCARASVPDLNRERNYFDFGKNHLGRETLYSLLLTVYEKGENKMSAFKLRKRGETKFQVLYEEDVVGSICVSSSEQVAELLRLFGGSVKAQMSAVPSMKLGPQGLSRAAILRGC